MLEIREEPLVQIIIFTEVHELVVVEVQGQNIKLGVIPRQEVMPALEIQIIIQKDTVTGADQMTGKGQGRAIGVHLLIQRETGIIMMKETTIVTRSLIDAEVVIETGMHILNIAMMTDTAIKAIGQEVTGQGQGVQADDEDNSPTFLVNLSYIS